MYLYWYILLLLLSEPGTEGRNLMFNYLPQTLTDQEFYGMLSAIGEVIK